MKRNSYVLDTNIWISAIISNTLSDLKCHILENDFEIYICSEMILELEDVLDRPKIRKYVKQNKTDFVAEIREITTLKTATRNYNEAPDHDDNYLYDICIDTKSILVTGDKVLLGYTSNPLVTTISRNEFLNVNL